MMCVNAAEGDGLIRPLNRIFEEFCVEQPVVAVIMANCYAVARCNSLEGQFGFDGRLRIHFCEEMNIRKSGEVIDKNSSADISSLRWSSSVYGYKTGSWAYELVDADNLSWCRCR